MQHVGFCQHDQLQVYRETPHPMGHYRCSVISQNLLLHFQEKQLWVAKQGWPCISTSNMYCSVAYAHEEGSVLAPMLHCIHIHFTLFIKYSQLRDQVFYIKLLHIFTLIAAVRPWKQGSQTDEAAICSRDCTESRLEQSLGICSAQPTCCSHSTERQLISMLMWQ